MTIDSEYIIDITNLNKDIMNELVYVALSRSTKLKYIKIVNLTSKCKF